jgi:uncharacterized membrane protein (UPF0127 family)
MAEVAERETEWNLGLSNRTAMGESTGMLFVFPDASRRGFWMKDTRIDLDILWIDASKNIVWIERDVPAEADGKYGEYDPPVLAKYVLELAAGSCDVGGLKIGDTAGFSD